MQLLFTVFVMLSGQPQPVLMDYMDLGQVTTEECRAHGQSTAAALMGLHPLCHAQQCFTLLRCKGGTETVSETVDLGDAI